MGYREEAREIHKEARWMFWKFWPLFVAVLLLLTSLFFMLRGMGLLGDTIVERMVFENSYQRSESIKAQIATDEANLVEIEKQLSNPNLDENTRFNLEAQASAARLRISAAKGRK